MSETRRLVEAAAALSQLLRNSGIPHAIHGSVLIAVLANSPHSDVCVPSSLLSNCTQSCPRKYSASLRVVKVIPSGVSVTRSLEVRTSQRPIHHGQIGQKKNLPISSVLTEK